MCPLRVLLIGASALVALAWLLHSYWAVEDMGEKQQQTSDKPKKVRFVPWDIQQHRPFRHLHHGCNVAKDQCVCAV